MPFRPGGTFCAPVFSLGVGYRSEESGAPAGLGGGRGSLVKTGRWGGSCPQHPRNTPGGGRRSEREPLSPGPLRYGWGSERKGPVTWQAGGCSRPGAPPLPGPWGPGALGGRARPHNGRKRGSALCPAGGADRSFLRPPWGRDPASPGAARPPARAPGCPPGTPSPAGRGVAAATGKARYARGGARRGRRVRAASARL